MVNYQYISVKEIQLRVIRYIWQSRDIRNKILRTLFILAVYRVVAHIPMPGADSTKLEYFMQANKYGGLMDLLSGGALQNLSVLALGITPYLSASLMLRLLIPIIPALDRKIAEDPRGGKRWLEKWTFYLTIPMASLQSLSLIPLFSDNITYCKLLINHNTYIIPTLSDITTICSLIAGTFFIVFLAELISEYGIREQGINIIIISGIISIFPREIGLVWLNGGFFSALLIFIIFAFIIFIVSLFQNARRNVPIMLPAKRSSLLATRTISAVRGTFPISILYVGTMPIVFAQSIILFPNFLPSFFIGCGVDWISKFSNMYDRLFNYTGILHIIILFILVIIFTSFYTSVLFDQTNTGENLRRAGAQIPGVHSGAPTQRYLNQVLRRVTIPGALLLAILAILPSLIGRFFLASQTINFIGLFIVTGSIRDIFLIIETEFRLNGYTDLLVSTEN